MIHASDASASSDHALDLNATRAMLDEAVGEMLV
jgi:hypothetical protein